MLYTWEENSQVIRILPPFLHVSIHLRVDQVIIIAASLLYWVGLRLKHTFMEISGLALRKCWHGLQSQLTIHSARFSPDIHDCISVSCKWRPLLKEAKVQLRRCKMFLLYTDQSSLDLISRIPQNIVQLYMYVSQSVLETEMNKADS